VFFYHPNSARVKQYRRAVLFLPDSVSLSVWLRFPAACVSNRFRLGLEGRGLEEGGLDLFLRSCDPNQPSVRFLAGASPAP